MSVAMPTTITVHLLEPDGRRHTLAARAGASLMRAATGAGIEGIAADCGGGLICATCHVYVDAAWSARLPIPSPDETAMLEMTAAPRGPTSRLSCQIALDGTLDGLVVRLPVTQY
jgi:ferredoxin, 2Fe-2S